MKWFHPGFSENLNSILLAESDKWRTWRVLEEESPPLAAGDGLIKRGKDARWSVGTSIVSDGVHQLIPKFLPSDPPSFGMVKKAFKAGS